MLLRNISNMKGTGTEGKKMQRRATTIFTFKCEVRWRHRTTTRMRVKARNGLAQTYNLLALLNTSLDLGDVPRCIVITKLLDLVLADDR
jgi:hypothetical protein